MKISYSAIETFKQCPQRYKFQEIDKIKAPKGKDAVFGTLIHSVLKFIHEKEPRFPTKEEALAYFHLQWPKAEKNIWMDESEEQVYQREGERLICEYYDRLDTTSRPRIVDLESSFSVLLPDDKGETHIVRGKIDRIDKLADGVFEIIDYKTNRRLPSQDSVDANMQLAIYHLALLERWPNLAPEEVRLSLYFLKHNEKLSTKRTSEQLAGTKKDILKVIGDITTSSFSPAPSKLCDFCAYRPLCPMWKHEYQAKEQPLTQADIMKVVDEYITLKNSAQKNEQRIEELKKSINEFCTANGVERVFGAGGYKRAKCRNGMRTLWKPYENSWSRSIYGKKLSRWTAENSQKSPKRSRRTSAKKWKMQKPWSPNIKPSR
ncbi:MAG: PD-(D/E)XK nuclease family protein [Patescibacteria group bacterium]